MAGQVFALTVMFQAQTAPPDARLPGQAMGQEIDRVAKVGFFFHQQIKETKHGGIRFQQGLQTAAQIKQFADFLGCVRMRLLMLLH